MLIELAGDRRLDDRAAAHIETLLYTVEPGQILAGGCECIEPRHTSPDNG